MSRTRALEVDTIELPAYWASFLIDGDASGFTGSEELARAERVIEELAEDGWEIIAVEDEAEPRFTWCYQLYDAGADCSGGEVLRYVMTRRVRT